MAGFNSISSEPRNDSRYISFLKKGLSSAAAEKVAGTYIGLQKGFNSVSAGQSWYIVESVDLIDQLSFLRSVAPTLQISNAELLINSLDYTLAPKPLTFNAGSFSANETNFGYGLRKEDIRMRFTISYTHPDSGNLVTEAFENFTPNLI